MPIEVKIILTCAFIIAVMLMIDKPVEKYISDKSYLFWAGFGIASAVIAMIASLVMIWRL